MNLNCSDNTLHVKTNFYEVCLIFQGLYSFYASAQSFGHGTSSQDWPQQETGCTSPKKEFLLSTEVSNSSYRLGNSVISITLCQHFPIQQQCLCWFKISGHQQRAFLRLLVQGGSWLWLYQEFQKGREISPASD